MKNIFLLLAGCLAFPFFATRAVSLPAASVEAYGPAAALSFELHYRVGCSMPGMVQCYPQAKGVALADCRNIIPMTESLWTPGEICADFRRRMAAVPEKDRKVGIIVMLKTERCATKVARACATTTAALEKRSTPLVGDFLVYGVQIKPRDGDNPPGSLAVETGEDAWKNQAAGIYGFEQGPGATLVLLDPAKGSKVAASSAEELGLVEWLFTKAGGRTVGLEAWLKDGLRKMGRRVV